MTITKIKTAVAAPEESQLQPGDLVTTANPARLAFGRVFDVGEGTARVWWSGFHGLPAVGGLTTHQTSELTFVERPAQYVSVTYDTPRDGQYSFVSAGDDVTLEEAAFDLTPSYTIVSRRTAATITTTDTTDSGADEDAPTDREEGDLPDAE